MKKILIDSEILNLNSPLFKGVISNLCNLKNRGYSLAITDEIVFADNSLKIILDSEGIDFIDKNNFDIKINKLVEQNKSYVVIGEKKFNDFKDATNFILNGNRIANINRKTKETTIKVNVNLDGNGNSEINTGIGFFNHMLEQISKHANIDLKISVKGDLNVDEHHTVEDTGISLGNSILKALGKRIGIQRYGFILPMDDSVSLCSIDLGGRPNLKFKCKFKREYIGEFPTELTEEFFRGLAIGMKANIYIKAKGKNDHHKIESIFKSFAKALNEACRIDERNNGNIPSTKGLL